MNFMHLRRKKGAGTVVEMMCGATLREARRSGPGGGGPNIFIDPPCQPTHQVRGVRARSSRALLFSYLPDVCLCDDVDDLPEGTLTWSLWRNSLPLFPARWALGPLRAYSFGGLHFCIIFRYDLLHNCFMYF